MNSNTIYRQLFSLCKLRFLPNVTQLKIEREGYDPYAMIFGIKKIRRSMLAEKSKVILKCNLYLRKQYTRLYYLALKGDLVRFEQLANQLLTRSSIYRMVMYHHVDKDWYINKEKKVSKIAMLVKKLLDTNDSTLIYNRQWIDKKPGDAARPLGAPKLQWKIILIMRLQILEILYNGLKQLYPWQHAGRSKRGLVTAWEQVVTQALKHKYIYEFDIKGFFDSISNQDTIPEIPSWNSWFNKMSNSLPSNYHLPLVTLDKAVQKYEKLQPEFAGFRVSNYIEDYLSKFEIGEDNQYVDQMLTIEEILKNYETIQVTDRAKERISLKGEYKDLMNDKEIENWRPMYGSGNPKEDYTEHDRALGRDNWKGLGIPNKGFPQGANTSPFMTCLRIMKEIGDSKNIVMYMDDGLLYANTQEEMNKIIDHFKTALNNVGCEIAPEKSGYILQGDGILKKSKFLGIEYDGKIFKSKTRKGTEITFLEPSFEAYLKALKEIVEEDNPGAESIANPLSPSGKKIVSWIEDFSKSKIKGIEFAIKKGFLSNLISISMDPEAIGIEEGNKGSYRKKLKIMNSSGLIKQVRDYNMTNSQKQDIKIHSTFATIRLLKLMRRAKIGKGILKF